MKKHSLLFALLLVFSAPAFSQLLDDVAVGAFCKTINKIIAGYPAKFEALKGEKIAADFISKWNSNITISTDSKCEVYTVSDETYNTWYFEFVCKEDWKASNTYENLKNNLKMCSYECGVMTKKEETFENSPTLKRYNLNAVMASPGYENLAIQLDLKKETQGYRVAMSIGNPIGF